MCDTFVILPKYTENGKTLFGKNSDRDPDETQNVIFIPGGKHNPEDMVNCTYIKRFHRIIEQDYASRTALFTEDRDKLESGFIEEANRLLDSYQGNSNVIRQKLKSFSSESFLKAEKFIEIWTDSVKNAEIELGVKRMFLNYWNKLNIKNKLNL